ncbi:helix-turn-helix domain-containing protein [Streptococcus sp. zg-86]|uniref:Helix-turn-helix domain-containing protein n=1 Tax=Streptococcus zhangguiae TaxID=2664091 RepID=A0A6I4RTT0_9STRE|nr:MULTISPECIES: helix-turn-helix transcriptional regulator [unclassified Streptococcus]MTB64303.1 helix-turn-helix domain-containing protein [Streptococcus sp. zg-86]MTB90613.1 helix-turn-helix domain-containing protein [Streptococcus sp. zg-36]MWV56392.1 helix-turn-helix domain-containing protein [Streptococcus sp. zg-70]QTH47399.1 helix-turn-helix transcriptional regulator [Streptococcus sp. zg-86]
MELGKQIQYYRKEFGLSQDDLAEELFVSRQTISNWERGTTYPDIQNLLLLCQIFDTDLNQLVQGDIVTFREILHGADYNRYERHSRIMTWGFSLCAVLSFPLFYYLGWTGIIIFLILWGVSLYYAHQVDRFKKKYNLKTIKELIAYSEGKSLSKIEKREEKAKAPYQNVLIVAGFTVVSALIALLVAGICLFFFP